MVEPAGLDKELENDLDLIADSIVEGQAGSKPDEDVEFFLNHPLNAKELTPEMLELPEYQALMNLAWDGTPDEVAENFRKHGFEHLGNITLG